MVYARNPCTVCKSNTTLIIPKRLKLSSYELLCISWFCNIYTIANVQFRQECVCQKQGIRVPFMLLLITTIVWTWWTNSIAQLFHGMAKVFVIGWLLFSSNTLLHVIIVFFSVSRRCIFLYIWYAHTKECNVSITLWLIESWQFCTYKLTYESPMQCDKIVLFPKYYLGYCKYYLRYGSAYSNNSHIFHLYMLLYFVVLC